MCLVNYISLFICLFYLLIWDMAIFFSLVDVRHRCEIISYIIICSHYFMWLIMHISIIYVYLIRLTQHFDLLFLYIFFRWNMSIRVHVMYFKLIRIYLFVYSFPDLHARCVTLLYDVAHTIMNHIDCVVRLLSWVSMIGDRDWAELSVRLTIGDWLIKSIRTYLLFVTLFYR